MRRRSQIDRHEALVDALVERDLGILLMPPYVRHDA